MRRLAPFVLSLMLAASALCVFACLVQAAAGPDPHAACHEGSQGNCAAVVQSHLPDAVYTAVPLVPAAAMSAAAPELAREPERLRTVSLPTPRRLPPLILRV